MLRSVIGAVVLVATLPLAAAAAQTAPVAAPDPARLAVARSLIEKFMPADRRDAMIEQMVRPMIENMRETMVNGPQFESIKAKDPKFVTTFDDFLKGELEHTLAATKAAMPAMVDAMARAYARRFSLAQLQEIDAFFDTPTGRAYAEKASTIMSDPDILAAQRAMMNKAMTGMQERLAGFAAKATTDPAKAE